MKNKKKYHKYATKIQSAIGINLDCYKASDYILDYFNDPLNAPWLAEEWNQEVETCQNSLKELRAGFICSSCSKKSW